MKQKTVRFLSFLSALCMVTTQSVPALAADSTQETNIAGKQSAIVNYEQASAFSVTIPKAIVLNSNKNAAYNVKVKGDIAGNESVTVIPDATVTLNDVNGKTPVTGTIYVIDKKYPSVINIVIPNNVYQIGNHAFANDNNGHSVYTVENVFIPNSVTKIGNMSFSYCETLKYVSISNNITSIGSKAFYTCTSLISVKYRGTVYDTKSVLEAVLVANGVNVSADAFEKTALK